LIKIEKVRVEVLNDEIQDNSHSESLDHFSEGYLNHLNESIHALSPEKIRERSTDILKPGAN
jgi:hypothetical protein